MLEVTCLNRQYPEFNLQADFYVQRGEFFSLLGPSGCGKTTLLRLIAGLETPDSGKIRLHGVDVTNKLPVERRIGLVFQDYALFPHLNVEANVGYGLAMQKKPHAERTKRVHEMLELFEIAALARRDVGSLSGGERQRVALARALAPEPWAILLDEPFSALDYGLRRRLREELHNLQRKAGFTAIFVTHHQEDAMALSDRLGVMDHGEIIQTGTPMEVYEHPQSMEAAVLLGEVNCLSGEVIRQTDQEIVVLVNNEVEWRLPKRSENASTGERVWVVVRPEDWQTVDENGLAVAVKDYEPIGPVFFQRIEGQGWTGRMMKSKGERCLVPGERWMVKADPQKVVIIQQGIS